jgi:hypothetical protein
MFFVGFGGLGLLLLIPALFIMFSKNGARWMPGLMWALLVLDLLVGSFLFAAIQGFMLYLMYHRRGQVPPVQPPDSSYGTPPVAGPYTGPGPDAAVEHTHGGVSHSHSGGGTAHNHDGPTPPQTLFHYGSEGDRNEHEAL